MNAHDQSRYALARDALESVKYFHKKNYSTVYIGKDLDQDQAALDEFDQFETSAKAVGAKSGTDTNKEDTSDYDVLATDNALFLGLNADSKLYRDLLTLSSENLTKWSAPITAHDVEVMEQNVSPAKQTAKSA